MLDWKKVSETADKPGYKTITTKYFAMPDGSAGQFTTWGKTGDMNAGVIAVTSDKKVIVARQFRPGPERVFDEVPGGGVNPGEDPAVAAARELLEETGYTSNEALEYLGPNYRDPYVNETNHYYLARNCRKLAEQSLDHGEFIEIVEIDIPTCIENAKSGKMCDGIAVLMAYDRLMEIQEDVHVKAT